MKKIIILTLAILFMNVTPVFAQTIDVQEDNGIYHITLKGNAIKKRINFILYPMLKTNQEVHKLTKSKLTINTGFFDPKNEKTISYIINKGELLEDPRFNENLYTNPVLSQNMQKILNRSEFRIVKCGDDYSYSIVPHNSKTSFSCDIVTSAQGGPQLLPEMRLEEEFFILKDEDGNIIRQSASVLDRTARTLIGIKGSDELHIIIVTNKNPKNIFEARDLCKSFGLDSAMAFDGGSSTSLDYKKIHVISTEKFGNDTGRRLKSFMIIR